MSTLTVVETPIATTNVPVTPTSPPIVHVSRVALSILSKAFSILPSLGKSIWAFSKTLLSPLHYFLSKLSIPLLYVLSPVILLAKLCAQILIIGPYSFIIGFLQAIHPLYTFLGATCIIAVAIGLCARGVVYLLHAFLFSEPEEAPVDPSANAHSPVVKEGSPRPKTRKRVSIKEEADAS